MLANKFRSCLVFTFLVTEFVCLFLGYIWLGFLPHVTKSSNEHLSQCARVRTSCRTWVWSCSLLCIKVYLVKSLVKTANYLMCHSVQRAIRIWIRAINTLTRVKFGTTSITVIVSLILHMQNSGLYQHFQELPPTPLFSEFNHHSSTKY